MGSAWSCNACQKGTMRENEHANRHALFCSFFFFFNSQFPCNSHHKVKQIPATEYVVAVMAESVV